jgi:DNA polymerase V
MKQNIALVDCNNFYCSAEKLFRPDLEKTPIVVLANNDSCVVSRSSEAKALGIKMGQPWFEIQERAQLDGVLALSSNYALYADISNRVMSVISGFSPCVEVYSIDEAFADLTGMPKLREVSYQIRDRVAQWIGIPVCVGIGPTKTLAKLANHVAKRHPRSKGVFNFNALNEPQKKQLLERLPAAEVWGVGGKLNAKLADMGIYTVQDLKTAHAPTLRSRFGVVMEKTQRELQEVPCLEIQEIQPNKQQIISSRSFGQAVTDVEVLQDAMSMFVANASVKLRAQQGHAAMIQVFLLTNRHRKDQPQHSPSITVPLPYPTADSLEISRWVGHLTSKLFKPGYAYKKAGIVLSGITSVAHRQGDLLEPLAISNEKLMQALDSLNKRFGRGTVKVSTQGAYKQWQMKQERKSPRYTTNWNEIPKV